MTGASARPARSRVRLRAASGRSYLGAMPELPEVETIRRQLAPRVEGRTLDALRDPRPRWCAPLAPRRGADAVAGRRVERARPARQVPRLGARGRRVPAHAPADDRDAAARPRGRPRPTSACASTLDDGHELRFCDPRRFGTGELALGDATRCDAFFAARLGRRAAGAELHGRAPARAGARPRARRSRRSCSTSGGRRRREHLRRRGAVPGADPPAAAGRPADRARSARRCATPCVTSLRPASTPGGATIDDFRHPDGVAGGFQHEFLVHLREGEPCLRCGGAVVQAASRRAAGPTSASAASRGPRGAAADSPAARRGARRRRRARQAAALVGHDQLLKAAEQLAVDDDLREAHHPGPAEQLLARPAGSFARLISSYGIPRCRAGPSRAAEGAGISGVDGDSAHDFTKYSGRSDARLAEDRGGRAALDPLRRGRPDPAPLHPDRGRVERDRQGRAARAQPLRRAAGAVLPRSASCCTRAAAIC